MARRKRGGDEGGGYNWMDTYGDMVTLLLTFFILLFSMSTVDQASWQVLVQAFSRSAPDSPQQLSLPLDQIEGDQVSDVDGQYEMLMREEMDIAQERPVSITELYDYLRAYVDKNDMSGSVSVERDAMNNIYMRFDNNIFFSSDSAVLREESYPVLQFMGECLAGVQDQILMVRVIGHTAAVAQKNYPVNDWELSSSRADQVVIFFEERTGLDPSKLMANGYGDNRPRFANATPEGRAQNRRVEIMVLGNEFNVDDPAQLLHMLQLAMDVEFVPDPALGSDVLESDITENPGNPPGIDPAASTAVPPEQGQDTQTPDDATQQAAPTDAADSALQVPSGIVDAQAATSTS